MGNFVGSAIKRYRNVEVVFEHVVGSVHVKFDLIQFGDLGIEIARKVKCSQLKGVLTHFFAVYDDLQLQLQLTYQFVRNVFFGAAVVKKPCENSLELETSLFFQLPQVIHHTALVLLESLSI